MQQLRKRWLPGLVLIVGGIAIMGVVFTRIQNQVAPGLTCGGPAGLPADGQWSSGTLMPTARAETAAIEVGDRIYVVGGMVRAWTATTIVEVYNTTDNSWQRLSPIPFAVHHAGVASVNGKVYVIGGYDDMGKMVNAAPDISNGWVYDPATDQWSDIAPMPAARAGGGIVNIGDKLYAVAGTGTGAKQVWVYDPTSDTWDTSRTSEIPVTTEHVPAVALNGKIYVIGGRWNDISTSAVQVYDPATDTWERKRDLPTPRSALSLAVLNGKIYTAGGEELANKCTYALREVYDPTSDTWTALADLPTGRHAMFSGVVDNRWYLIGGSTQAGAGTEPGLTGIVEIFTPDAAS